MSTNRDALDNLKLFGHGQKVRRRLSPRNRDEAKRYREGKNIRYEYGYVEGTALMQTGPPSGTQVLDLIVRVRWDQSHEGLSYAKTLEVAPCGHS